MVYLSLQWLLKGMAVREAIDIDTPVALTSGWSVMFADLLALLLAFFILVFSLTPIEDVSWYNMTRAFKGDLNKADTSLDYAGSIIPSDIPLSLSQRYIAGVIGERRLENQLLMQADIEQQGDMVYISIASMERFNTADGRREFAEAMTLFARLSKQPELELIVSDAGHMDAALQQMEVLASFFDSDAVPRLNLRFQTDSAENITNYEPDGRYASSWKLEIRLKD